MTHRNPNHEPGDIDFLIPENARVEMVLIPDTKTWADGVGAVLRCGWPPFQWHTVVKEADHNAQGVFGEWVLNGAPCGYQGNGWIRAEEPHLDADMAICPECGAMTYLKAHRKNGLKP